MIYYLSDRLLFLFKLMFQTIFGFLLTTLKNDFCIVFNIIVYSFVFEACARWVRLPQTICLIVSHGPTTDRDISVFKMVLNVDVIVYFAIFVVFLCNLPYKYTLKPNTQKKAKTNATF